jgi:hypothetical protein
MSTQNQYLKKLHKSALQGVVNDLVQEKEEGWKRRTARGSYTSKLQCLESMGISINRDALYKRVERQHKKQQNKTTRPVEELAIVQKDPEVSSDSSPSTGGNAGSDNVSKPMILSSKGAGRPRGPKQQKERGDITKYRECLHAIAQAYHIEYTHHKVKKKRLAKGYLKQLIQEKKDEFGVSANIPLGTVRSRIKRGRLAGSHEVC